MTGTGTTSHTHHKEPKIDESNEATLENLVKGLINDTLDGAKIRAQKKLTKIEPKMRAAGATDEMMEAFARKTLIDAAFDEAYPRLQRLVAKRRLSWGYVADVLIQATATITLAGIGLVVASAVTKNRLTATVDSTGSGSPFEGTTTEFRATERPSRKQSA